MRFQSLALLAGVSAVAADSTVTLFIPGLEAQSLEGKILGSAGTMTTYLLNCPAGLDPSKCGLPMSGYPFTEGGSSLEMTYSYGSQTYSQDCKLQGSTYVNCFATMTSDGSTSTMTTGIAVASMPYGGFFPVHITATEEAAVSASTGASASAPTATTTGLTTLTGTVTSTGSGSSATSTPTGSTNAAMPMATGNAGWLIGGAVALAMAVV